MNKLKKGACTLAQEAPSAPVTLRMIAPPQQRILAQPSQVIEEQEMAIACGADAWIGEVRPIDSRRVLFKRKGKKYILNEGEFTLLSLGKTLATLLAIGLFTYF